MDYPRYNGIADAQYYSGNNKDKLCYEKEINEENEQN